MARLGYMTVGSNQLAQAKAFYDALLGSIGMAPWREHPSGGRLYGSRESGVFGVLGPHDGQPATAGNGTMLGFGLDSPAAVAAFHATALALGGTDAGAPGERGSGLYFAYVRDLDGNKLCAYSFATPG